MSDRKALIVDDEIHIVQVIAIKLKNNGYEVITAENGNEAYEKALEQKPDVVITDYQMPGMTGVELIRKLRENPETAHTAAVIITARGFELEDDLENELDISACLNKPFSPREVLNCVDGVLAQRAA
jgi:two-component system, OmpR family, alkaline phosphatase synthesis response regulator PhoP